MNGTCSQAVSQSAGNQKEEMDQQSPSASVSDAAPTETRLSAANNKKVDGFLGGRKKGWGPRAEFCLENRALGGLVQ